MEASKWEDREAVKERPEGSEPEEVFVEEETTVVEIPETEHVYCECDHTPVDNGAALGGIGFVSAFIPFLALPALVVSIVALRKSKGHKNGLAIAGILVSLVSLVVMFTVGIAMGAAALAFIQSINEAVANVNHVTQVTDQAVTSVQGMLPDGTMVEQLGSSTQGSDLITKAQELLNSFVG